MTFRFFEESSSHGETTREVEVEDEEEVSHDREVRYPRRWCISYSERKRCVSRVRCRTTSPEKIVKERKYGVRKNRSRFSQPE